MPKNKSRNAFFFFMSDWKKRAEAKGRKFPNGFKDVQTDPDCNAEWQGLTKQEKGPYEAMAKKDKITSQISNTEKKTTYGESIRMLEEKKKERQKFLKDMQENIKLKIDTAVNLKILPKQKFCFVHVNWFFSTIINNNIRHFPAEYAFGVFSLEDGIEDVHHVIVSAKIPLGFRYEALMKSEISHKIPVEYTGGENDFVVMYVKLINFLEPRKIMDKYPPLYTTRNNMDVVQSLLIKLSDAAQSDKEQFKIYELESLYIHLANEAFKKRNDREIKYIPAYAERVFTNYTYIFERGFECHFHKFVDGGCEYCSKSILQQWAWTLCDEFCESLEVEKYPGIHYPDKSDTNFSTLTHSLNNLKIKGTQSEPENKSVLSMTGVSEQHRQKVSSRTYQEEVRRRNESQPVHIIDYGQTSESADKPTDETIEKTIEKTINKPDEWARHVPSYLNEKPMRPPNIDPHVLGLEEYIYKNNENFPPIGGRGVSCRSARAETRKMPLGKGQGHA